MNTDLDAKTTGKASVYTHFRYITLDSEPKIKATDEQIGGKHYKDMKIQPIEFIHKNNIPFMEGNIIKYICRHRNKNKAEDIKKVIHYCKLILELEYNEKI